jgi:hypothetical protein
MNERRNKVGSKVRGEGFLERFLVPLKIISIDIYYYYYYYLTKNHKKRRRGEQQLHASPFSFSFFSFFFSANSNNKQ